MILFWMKKNGSQLQTIMDEAGELPKRTPHQKLVNTKIAEKVTKNY